MNKFTIFLAALAVLVIGYFIVSNMEFGVESADAGTKSGTIIDISLEQMAFDGPGLITIQALNGETSVIAVPSMGIQLCAARDNIADISTAAVSDWVEVSGTVDSEGQIVPCESADHYLTIMGTMKDAAFGFEFEYRKGPDGYVTLEDTESNDEEYVTGVTLFNKKELDAMSESSGPREGPPALHMRVYRNDSNLDAAVWVLEKPSESNIGLAVGEVQETVVGGANAVFYVVDGLYRMDTYVVAHGEHVYLLAGSYLEVDSSIYKDFKDLVASFTFIEPTSGASQGKIDVRVACESALAYMSFINGEEADAFVEACIDGEHPDVIDRYIEDLGLDGATI